MSGIFTLFAHWSDCVDRNDKVFTLLYYINSIIIIRYLIYLHIIIYYYYI
jgi:hypothetical protein